jgi:hypothetical protein
MRMSSSSRRQSWIGRLSSAIDGGSEKRSPRRSLTYNNKQPNQSDEDVEGSLGPGIGRNTAVIVLCIYANYNIIDDEPQSHASK